MQDNQRTIKIESILGGHAPSLNFARDDQFLTSIGIDPALPTVTGFSFNDSLASGILRPTSTSLIGSLPGAPMWIIPNPKTTTMYIYDTAGSVYTLDAGISAVTGLGDLNDGGTAAGNGCEYYDNYIYFSRNTTIARYGPLNGTPAFTDDFWVTTLGKTALQATTYPATDKVQIQYPNHVLHRHSDGKLYIADVVGNQGTIHYISTSKATVEGDTDNGSTYSKVQVGYGLWPTAIESYGSDLAISFYEGPASSSFFNINRPVGKIAFWDTTSQNINRITWVEFPDPIISALKNINGTLYVVSGPQVGQGYRISKFVGGYTYEEIYYSETGQPPYPGAIDGAAQRVLFGSYTDFPETTPAVYSYGLQKSSLGQGLFNIMGATASTGFTAIITAVSLLRLSTASSPGLAHNQPITGWSDGTTHGIDKAVDNKFSSTPAVWWSKTYRIGQSFKITKIRILLDRKVGSNMSITPKIYTDNGQGTIYTLTEINNTNYPNSEKNIVYRLNNVTGLHDFILELRWTNTSILPVNLPITIEYELIDD